MRAGRSRRRRPHSTLNGAMSGREGVLGEPPLIETLDEPPIGNEACPQTSANPDAVVLGGIPLDDETPAPGERAKTGTPSASSTHGRNVMHEDKTPFLNSNEQLSSAPMTQTMSAEREELTMDPIYAFYTTGDSIYSCCFAVVSHGDTVVAHDLLRESPASFDTPAGQEFQKTNDITCIRGCWKPALKITAFPLVAQIVHQVYPLTATSSLACINFHTALSCLSIASVAYLGGSHRKRMIEAHGLREPPCNLGCCALSPPFNPYCCWFWCVPCAAAQEHKAMKRMLRRRASDVTHDRL
jgi:hypothetical protein